MIVWYDAHEIDSGPAVFRTWDGKCARQGQLELSILNSRLVHLSTERPALFPDKNMDVMADFSMWRLFR